MDISYKKMKTQQKTLHRKGKAELLLISMMFVMALFLINNVSAYPSLTKTINLSNSYSCLYEGANYWFGCSNGDDNSFSTFATYPFNSGSYNGTFYENITLPNPTIYTMNWTSKSNYYFDTIIRTRTETYYFNYSLNDWQLLYYSNCKTILDAGIFTLNCTKSIPLDGIDSTRNLRIKTKLVPGNTLDSKYYEGIVILNYSSLDENSQTYNNVTTETSSENFILNLSIDTVYYPVSSANLIYNGTTYSSNQTASGPNAIFTSSFNIPAITGTQQNRSFYWNIALTNSSGINYFNSTSHNQTVNAIALGECSGLNIYKALNITAWNEKTLLRVNPFDLKGTLTYSSSIGGSQKNYSFTNSSIAEKSICININGTLYLNGLLEYSNTTFQTKNYYFLDYPISNNTIHLKLYMLPTTSSTSFIVKVQDTSILPLPNYYVSIFRYDAGNETPYLVQVVNTDINGQSIAFFETETVDYKFLIYDSLGNLVYTSDKQKIIPQETPYTIVFTIGTELPNPISYMANLTGLTYSLTHDKPTFLVTYTYSDINTSFTSSQLIVKGVNSSGVDNIICSSSKTDASGVMTCDLTGNQTGSYYATAYITRGTQIFIYRINFEIETFSDTAGLLGVLGGFLIILISCFLFAYNELAGIWTVNFAVIMVNLIGMVHFGIVFISSMIAISIIISIVLERG